MAGNEQQQQQHGRQQEGCNNSSSGGRYAALSSACSRSIQPRGQVLPILTTCLLLCARRVQLQRVGAAARAERRHHHQQELRRRPPGETRVAHRAGGGGRITQHGHRHRAVLKVFPMWLVVLGCPWSSGLRTRYSFRYTLDP